MWNASEVVREVGIDDFRVATEQLVHLDYRLLGVAPFDPVSLWARLR